MDQEVAKTLGELELKLQQLEHELTSIGPRDTPSDTPPDSPQGRDSAPPDWGVPADESSVSADSRSSQAQPSGRLVDEAMESQADEAIADSDGFGGTPMFGGEEVPAQPAMSGQDWKVDVRETAYGEITSEAAPTPQPGPQPIDRAELVRFKQRLEHTMAELSEELARLLLPKPPT